MSPEQVKAVGLFDPSKIATILQEYRTDKDPASLVQKDALLNHLLGLHVLHRTFIQAA